jgi:hypothetical protein
LTEKLSLGFFDAPPQPFEAAAELLLGKDCFAGVRLAHPVGERRVACHNGRVSSMEALCSADVIETNALTFH